MSERAFSQAVALRDTLRLTGVSTATPSGTQNNYAPSGGSTASMILLAPTAALTITGLSIGQASGRVVLLANTSSAQYITLVTGSLSSTSTNRFALAENYVVPPGTGVMLVYHGADSRWHLYGGKPSTIARIYTSSGVWDPLPGLVMVSAICIGGGGGGGAGCVGAAGSLRRGGWGAAGGGWSERTIPAAAIAGSKIISVGSGGAGGVGVSTAGNGADGQVGDDSEFDVMLRATGGGLGRGGTATALLTGTPAGGLGTLSDGTDGVSSNTTGIAGGSPSSVTKYGGGGGGAGGGITTGNAVSNGGAGSTSGTLGPIASAGSAGSAGGNGGSGGSGASNDTAGGGGGGGASSITANAGDGGDGGLYGGGGGGGGASLTTRIAGDGGDGADGLVIVIEHY